MRWVGLTDGFVDPAQPIWAFANERGITRAGRGPFYCVPPGW